MSLKPTIKCLSYFCFKDNGVERQFDDWSSGRSNGQNGGWSDSRSDGWRDRFSYGDLKTHAIILQARWVSKPTEEEKSHLHIAVLGVEQFVKINRRNNVVNTSLKRFPNILKFRRVIALYMQEIDKEKIQLRNELIGHRSIMTFVEIDHAIISWCLVIVAL